MISVLVGNMHFAAFNDRIRENPLYLILADAILGEVKLVIPVDHFMDSFKIRILLDDFHFDFRLPEKLIV